MTRGEAAPIAADLPVFHAPGLICREKTYSAGSQLHWHSHSYAVMALVIDGTFQESCGGQTDLRRPGALRIMPASECHSNQYGPSGARCFLAELHGERLSGLEERASALRRIGHFEAGTGAATLARRMHRECRIGDDASSLAVEGLLCELLATVSRIDRIDRIGVASRVPVWVARVRDRLEDEFSAPPGLVELAREAGVHPGYLCRAFRHHFGCTPGTLVRRLRIASAEGALRTGQTFIGRIALQCGFSDHAHFTRSFRAEIGMTPTAYRALHGRGHGSGRSKVNRVQSEGTTVQASEVRRQ